MCLLGISFNVRMSTTIDLNPSKPSQDTNGGTYTKFLMICCYICKGIARTQSPTIKNYAFKLPTFGVIVGVNPTEVQWMGLTLGKPPS